MRFIHDQRSTSYATIFGVAVIVIIWAVVHDQYLVRIAPEHFTEYHEPLWGIREPALLALLYAIAASMGPGLLLGLATAFFGRSGSNHKIPPRSLILGSVFVVIATEITAASSGLFVFVTDDVFYPETWFPDLTLPIKITQTIQISAYLGAAVFSAIFLMAIHVRRGAEQGGDRKPDHAQT